jgi:hypothetical protein
MAHEIHEIRYTTLDLKLLFEIFSFKIYAYLTR